MGVLVEPPERRGSVVDPEDPDPGDVRILLDHETIAFQSKETRFEVIIEIVCKASKNQEVGLMLGMKLTRWCSLTPFDPHSG